MLGLRCCYDSCLATWLGIVGDVTGHGGWMETKMEVEVSSMTERFSSHNALLMLLRVLGHGFGQSRLDSQA